MKYVMSSLIFLKINDIVSSRFLKRILLNVLVILCNNWFINWLALYCIFFPETLKTVCLH